MTVNDLFDLSGETALVTGASSGIGLAVAQAFAAAGAKVAVPVFEIPQVLVRYMKMTPLRRAGEPHEIAGAAVFLASKAGAFVNGQTLIVDGGSAITDGS